MGLSGEAEMLDRAEILCAQSGEAVLAALAEIRALADYTNKAVPNLKLNFD